MPKLREVDISYNFFNFIRGGRVPNIFGPDSQVEVFNAESSSLYGPIPDASTMGNRKLKTLILRNNFLCGPLVSLPAGSVLSTLDLGENQFTGTIPSTYSRNYFRRLKLSKNENLEGPVPYDLGLHVAFPSQIFLDGILNLNGILFDVSNIGQRYYITGSTLSVLKLDQVSLDLCNPAPQIPPAFAIDCSVLGSTNACSCSSIWARCVPPSALNCKKREEISELLPKRTSMQSCPSYESVSDY